MSAEPSKEIKAETSEFSEAATVALELHNKFRAEHDARPLTLTLILCKEAEGLAKDLACGMQSEKCEFGRNIYKMETSVTGYIAQDDVGIARDAVNSWYRHQREYKWRVPSASPKGARLFSQIVWKSSQTMGIGVVNGESGNKNSLVVVALYSPPGNLKSDQCHFDNVSRAGVKSTSL